MSHAPAFRSLSVETPPSSVLAGRTASPAPITSFVPVSSPGASKSHALVGRSEAQSPVRLVSERDLLKRVMRKKFEAQFSLRDRTPERWCNWIDERWNASPHRAAHLLRVRANQFRGVRGAGAPRELGRDLCARGF